MSNKQQVRNVALKMVTLAMASHDGGLLLTELSVVSVEVDDIGVGEDGHVLELGLSDGWAVVRDDQELGLSISKSLHAHLVSYTQKQKVRSKFERHSAVLIYLPILYFPDLTTRVILELRLS